ncbi:MAG: hypothetical protein ACLT0Y_00395 [Christensenellales bacterium]
MAEFIKIPAEQFDHNPFTLIEHEWMLITAEKEGKVNTMTANWGGLGEIWYKRAAYIVVRPHRYTKEFLDAADTFSLTFLMKATGKRSAIWRSFRPRRRQDCKIRIDGGA